jgi:hypothetical protein
MRRRLPGALGHLRAVHAAVRLQRDPAGRRHKDHAVPRLTLLALVAALAGCVAGGPERIAAFRPQGAPIWSAAAFDATRIEGRWQQVAAFSARRRPRTGG